MEESTLRWPTDKEREEMKEVCSIGEVPHTEMSGHNNLLNASFRLLNQCPRHLLTSPCPYFSGTTLVAFSFAYQWPGRYSIIVCVHILLTSHGFFRYCVIHGFYIISCSSVIVAVDDDNDNDDDDDNAIVTFTRMPEIRTFY